MQDLKLVYLGPDREVTATNGARIRLVKGRTYQGEVAAWLFGQWPQQFRREAPGADRVTKDVPSEDLRQG